MQLRNCVRCGKMFMCVSKRVCPACQDEMDQLFEKVRLYVKAHAGATVFEISEALEMEESEVEEFVREGRFDVVSPSLMVTCLRCGAPIRHGKYCLACAAAVEKELKGPSAPAPAAPAPSQSESSERKMYVVDHIVDRNRNSR